MPSWCESKVGSPPLVAHSCHTMRSLLLLSLLVVAVAAALPTGSSCMYQAVGVFNSFNTTCTTQAERAATQLVPLQLSACFAKLILVVDGAFASNSFSFGCASLSFSILRRSSVTTRVSLASLSLSILFSCLPNPRSMKIHRCNPLFADSCKSSGVNSTLIKSIPLAALNTYPVYYRTTPGSACYEEWIGPLPSAKSHVDAHVAASHAAFENYRLSASQ